MNSLWAKRTALFGEAAGGAVSLGVRVAVSVGDMAASVQVRKRRRRKGESEQRNKERFGKSKHGDVVWKDRLGGGWE